MSTLRCKKCGGDLNIIDVENSICECEFCGSKETLPKTDDEKIMKLYDRANRLRLGNEFDKASGIYESIIEESDTEAEAYWGLVLCKYGIEYVDDPATGDKIPTCHRLSFDSVMEDSDFELVMENATDALARNIYRDNAKQIEDIRRGIIEVSDKEEPYDIFICYKETDENGNRTIDSVMAQDIYDQLTAKGYRVFFSRITLEDKLGQEYEPYIFAALNSAKIMLAFGTSYDYYNAVWVKNEWSRYLKLMSKDKSKKLIPCYKDIDAYDIPTEFKHLQAQDMGKVGADQDLIRGIEKILGTGNAVSTSSNTASNQDIQAAVASAVAAHNGSNANTLLERGFMTLEDGDFDKADSLFEEVLNQNPKCAEAYMGKLMAYYQVENAYMFEMKIFDALKKIEEIEIKPDFDVKSVVKTEYTLGTQLSDGILSAIEKAWCVSYYTYSSALRNANDIEDYISYYCSLDNDESNETKLDDRCYSRYLQYSTDDILAKYNINTNIKARVAETIKEEEKELDDIKVTLSREGLCALLDEANKNVKAIVGDEYDEIDKKYKSELHAWKKENASQMAAWEKECQEITEDWPRKKAEIQEAWKIECARITIEYNKKRAEYDEKVLRVTANNARVENAFAQAKMDYEKEKKKIENQISILNSEYASLGIFKKKQKEMVKHNISVLEEKKKSLVYPNIASFGQLINMPAEIGELQLPVQPVVSETPILPPKPVQTEMPIMGVSTAEVDAVTVLCELFDVNDIDSSDVRSQGEYEKDILQKKRELATEETRLKELGITIVETGESKIILDFGNLGENINCIVNRWRVLESDGKNLLIIAENVIDVVRYNEKRRDITWEKCTLRAYLNGSFYNNFSEPLKSRIMKVKLENKNNPSKGTPGGNDTEDRIFCLSIDEAKKYFKDDNDRIAYPTDYAKKQTDSEHFIDEKTGGARWWLRSPGYRSYRVANVNGDGDVYDYGLIVNIAYIGVRPAMWISLE